MAVLPRADRAGRRSVLLVRGGASMENGLDDSRALMRKQRRQNVKYGAGRVVRAA
jgi:hypothetical protein